MSNVWLTQHHVQLLDQSYIQFHKTPALHSASLLPYDDLKESLHGCLEVTDLIQSVRPDLTYILLATPDGV